MESNEILLTTNQMETFKELLNDMGINRDTISLKLSPGVEEGENFGGIIINAVVTCKKTDGQQVLHFIIKCAPTSENLRKLVPVREPFVREIELYTKVFSQFTAIQKNHAIKKPFESYPICYSSLDKSGEEMLILQNLKSIGFKLENKRKYLDYNHTLSIVKEYARLHALSYALRHHKPDIFQEFENLMKDPIYFDFKFNTIEVAIQHRIQYALKALNLDEYRCEYNKMLLFSKNLVSIYTALLDSENQYHVLSHIDCGIANFLFKYESAPNVPSHVKIIDWQMARFESPAVDLVTFLFSATDKAVRERYDELILAYYDCLCLFLEEFGCNGKDILPFEVLQLHLKKYGILGMVMAIGLIYIYTSADQKLPDVFKNDSHSEGFSFLYELDNSSQFNARIRDVIRDFSNLGYNFS